MIQSCEQQDSVYFRNTPSLYPLIKLRNSINNTTSLVPRSWNRFDKWSIVKEQYLQIFN